jgi:hypothetical protein
MISSFARTHGVRPAAGGGTACLLLATDDPRYGGTAGREHENTSERRWKVPAETAMLWAIEESP